MAQRVDARDYRRLFDETAVPTLVVDVGAGRVVDCNDATARLLGLERDRVIGAASTDFVTEAVPGDRGTDDAEPVRSLRRISTQRGVRTVEVTVLPADADGLSFVQAFDCTELLNANASLLSHTVELEARTGALSTVSARIAHDLRGPLATIAGFVDLLRSETKPVPEEQRGPILERVSANAKTLASMVTEMLEEARGTDVVELASTTRSVDDLFARLHAMFEVEQIGSDVRLGTTTTIDELPVPVGALRQVLVNLVDNSIKFRSPDRPLEVAVTVTSSGDVVEITVADNGSGIAGDPEALFARGARGDNAAGVAGSGFGLAYARATVEALGGTLTAERGDPGATFRILLPPQLPVVTAPVEQTFAGGLTAFQLDRIIDVAPVPMILVDLTLQVIVRTNSSAAALIGMPPEEIIGRSARDFLEEPTDADGLRRDVLDRAPASQHRSRTTVVAGDRRFPAALWMVGFEDSALLVVQVQDLTGVVDD